MNRTKEIVQPSQIEPPTVNYADYSILLVDDTPNNLDVLVDFLQEYGFTLRVALSGENALKRIHYDAPSIVLLDVLLPGIDGFETCCQLKADPTTRHIPIIFMTSLASAEDKVRGFEVGAVDYVTKPLQQAEVLARITTHLQQQGLTQTLRDENKQLAQSHQVERERLLQAVAQQRDQLRGLATKLTEVQEQERRSLARELHDELGQALTAIRINLAEVEKGLPSTASERVQQRLIEATLLADETLDQIRELSLNLRPSMLDDLGLIPTLRWYVKRFGERTQIEVILDTDNFGPNARLSPLLETALYRIVQESLTNIARHAQATQVRVYLAQVVSDSVAPTVEVRDVVISQTSSENIAVSTQEDRHKRIPTLHWCEEPIDVVARIEDNGRGFLPAAASSGMGLLGMRERVTALGGIWQLDSAPNAGTQIQIRLPLEAS